MPYICHIYAKNMRYLWWRESQFRRLKLNPTLGPLLLPSQPQRLLRNLSISAKGEPIHIPTTG